MCVHACVNLCKGVRVCVCDFFFLSSEQVTDFLFGNHNKQIKKIHEVHQLLNC